MDTGALIALVFARTPIWDKKNQLHSNRNVIEKLWKEIAEEMHFEEAVLRKKWKYLREKFGSEYKKRPMSRSGDASDNCPSPKWPFFQHLLFLKDMVQPRASSGSITSSIGTPLEPSADTGPADDAKIDDKTSLYSQDSFLTSVTKRSGDAIGNQEMPEVITEDYLQSSQVPGPSLQTPVCSKMKRKSQEEDYFKQMCRMEERKLEFMIDKRAQENNTYADREDEDHMFLKTLLPHIRKIPAHTKLKFRNRIQSVVDEFAYHQPDTAVHLDYS